MRPNHLWHLDFVHRHINRANTFTLILIDDHSRFVVAHGVDDAERADMVISTFGDAVARDGKPEMVMHDRGAALWSWRGISRFTKLLTELGIDQIVAEEAGEVEEEAVGQVLGLVEDQDRDHALGVDEVLDRGFELTPQRVAVARWRQPSATARLR